MLPPTDREIVPVDTMIAERPLRLRPSDSLADLKQAIEAGEPASWIDVLVTPAMAKLMLQYNKPSESNRILSARYIASQVATIKAKRWVNTGEPIIFSNKCLLNDGQHRLSAVVSSGTPAIMDIRFGVERSAVYDTNTGRKRTPAHALQIAGFAAGAMHGSICRLYLAYERGLPGSIRIGIDNGEVVAMIQEDERFLHAARLVQACPRYVNNAATATTLYMALRTGNVSAVQEFAHVVATGEGSAQNPPHRYREAALQSGGQYSTDARIQLFARGLQAWNAYRTGKPIGRWWKTGEDFPKLT
jgi:hypothetical protein